jgi:hypothetical protein
MKDAAEEEKRIAIESESITEDGIPLVTVVTDGCWSRRSYGSNYTALSGSACIIGERTGKLLYYGVKNKYCHICEPQKEKGVTDINHKCNINFEGPSTQMESDIIVEGFKKSLQQYGIIYNEFIADGDSSVHKRLLEAKPYENIQISKIECKNHLWRNFRNKLKNIGSNKNFQIQYRNKLKHNTNRIESGINGAVKNWRGSSLSLYEKIENLAKDIKNVPYHVFGDHQNCSKYFCNRSNEENLVKSMILDGIFNEINHHVFRLAQNSKNKFLFGSIIYPQMCSCGCAIQYSPGIYRIYKKNQKCANVNERLPKCYLLTQRKKY